MNNLERKEESQRKEYLTNIAKEVILTFGPDYYRDFKEPIISDTITFRETFKEDPVLRNKNFYGRKYYSVKYLYDPSIEKFLYNFVAEVDIWADDGQPKEVRFGNGYGQNFYITSYKKWKKRGIKESEIIVFNKSTYSKSPPNMPKTPDVYSSIFLALNCSSPFLFSPVNCTFSILSTR